MAGNDDCISQIHKNIVIIESVIFDRNNEWCWSSFEAKVYNRCWDANVRVGRFKKVDPALQFYSGIPLMTNDNEDIKEVRGNGTKCVCISVNLKKDCNVGYTNFDGRLVHTVSILDIIYIVCETIVKDKSGRQKYINYTQRNILLPFEWNIDKIQHKVGVKIILFDMNSNIAKTGHKCQGASLNRMVVRSWEYGRSLIDIFICEKLNYTNKTSQWIQIYRRNKIITNYKSDLWHAVYDDEDLNNFDAVEVGKGIQLYYSLNK